MDNGRGDWNYWAETNFRRIASAGIEDEKSRESCFAAIDKVLQFLFEIQFVNFILKFSLEILSLKFSSRNFTL